jgi:VWFA-related protein
MAHKRRRIVRPIFTFARPGRARTAIAGVAVASIASVLAVIGARGQEPSRPTFQTSTQLVRLEVSVLDSARRPVRGLTASDFTVQEDGKARPIQAFSEVDLPARERSGMAAWLRDAPLDVTVNAGADEGRLVVVAFDWSIRAEDQASARRIANAAVDALGPTDLGAVIFTSGMASAGAPQNFTSDHARHKAAVDAPFAVAPHADRKAPGNANGVRLDDPEGYESGDCHCRACSLEALTRIAKVLQGVSSRPKVVLFIATYVRTFENMLGAERVQEGGADGFGGMLRPVASARPGACSSTLRDARDAMTRAASAANMVVHVIDPIGLETEQNTPLGTRERIAERQSTLPVVADLTGGRAVLDTNAPESKVESILDESASYYVLGHIPGEARKSGRVHRIDVKVARPGLVVRTRREYVEGPVSSQVARVSAADERLSAALGGVVPVKDQPLELASVPFAFESPSRPGVLVLLRTPSSPPGVSAAAREAHLLVAAFDARGRSRAADDKRLAVTQGRGRPLEFVTRLDVKPGTYEIRASAALSGQPAGSVFGVADVPDFARAPLALSGILVRAGPDESVALAPDLADLLPFVPSLRREFDRTHQLQALVRAYVGNESQPRSVHGAWRVRDASNAIAIERPIDAAVPASNDRTFVDLSFDLPADRLSPGRYLLRADVHDGVRTAHATMRFSVN